MSSSKTKYPDRIGSLSRKPTVNSSNALLRHQSQPFELKTFVEQAPIQISIN